MPRGTSSASGDIAAQTEQVLRNLRTALTAAGAGPEHVVKWNVVVVDGQDFGSGYAAFQRAWGDRPNPPVMGCDRLPEAFHGKDVGRRFESARGLSERPANGEFLETFRCLERRAEAC
jgi:hypothetical protein